MTEEEEKEVAVAASAPNNDFPEISLSLPSP